MGHNNKISLVRQCELALSACMATGTSKHKDKQTGANVDKIYSWNTFRAYQKHTCYFVDWCKSTHGCKTLEQCRQYVGDWLDYQQQKGLSAYTVQLERSALVKLYHDHAIADIKLVSRRTYDSVTRSRGNAERDKHFSVEKNADLVLFARCVGLRRSEMSNLRGSYLVQGHRGGYMVHIQGKGGRWRYAPVIGSKEQIERICALMRDAGDKKVFPVVHSCADIHGYRREYAQQLYDSVARPLDVCRADKTFRHPGRAHCDRNAVYWRRGSRKGDWLDKRAVLYVSRALGHNRVSVAAEHYLM